MTTPEGEGTQSGAEGAQSGAGESAPGTTGTPETNPGNGTQSGAETQLTAEDRLRQEAETYRERMKAADKRASDFENKLKQLVEKDMPAQEKLQRDYEEATKQVQSLRSTNSELSLKVAFLEDNTYKWRNAKRAMQLVDLNQVEIGDDGTVTGLKEALKALATSDPYLLEAATEEEKKTTSPPGTAPGNNGGTGSTKPNSKNLATRFPSMNTRARSK